MYKISFMGNRWTPAWDIMLEYEEMVELIVGFLHNPERGNEFYDDMVEKAKVIYSRLPKTDY